MTDFLAGAVAAYLSMLPAAIVVVLLCRYCLDTSMGATVEASDWRSAAAQASVAAAVNGDRAEQAEERGAGAKVRMGFGGGMVTVTDDDDEDANDDDCDHG